MASSVVGR